MIKLIFSIFFINSLTFASFLYLSEERVRTTKYPVISKRDFKKIAKLMEKEFLDFANLKNEKLLVYAGWNDPTADQALARRWETAQVLIFRGMAHRKEIDRDALILIICHEIGHLYGGEPLKNKRDQIAAEGQADYFATNSCLKRGLSLLSVENLDKRAEKAIYSVGKFLANNWGHTHPSETTPDNSSVERTNLSYPTPQCRFDTYLLGLRNEQRPSCWYKE